MKPVVAMHQHQGGREYQQDAMAIRDYGEQGMFCILADGMGGYEGGEIASRILSEKMRGMTFGSEEELSDAMYEALMEANAALRSYKEAHPEVASMGSTLTALFVGRGRYRWISVGDSPLYLIRRGEAIERINANHSVAGMLDLQVKRGEIDRQEAQNDPRRHMLTSAVTGAEISMVDRSESFPIRRGDLFVLASDGIETIPPERIETIVRQRVPRITQENLQRSAEALIDEVIARQKPNQDNVTVLLVGLEEDSVEEDPPTKIPGLNEGRKEKDGGRRRLPLPWPILAVALLAIVALFWTLLSRSETKAPAPALTPVPVTQERPATPAPAPVKGVPKKREAAAPTAKVPVSKPAAAVESTTKAEGAVAEPAGREVEATASAAMPKAKEERAVPKKDTVEERGKKGMEMEVHEPSAQTGDNGAAERR